MSLVSVGGDIYLVQSKSPTSSLPPVETMGAEPDLAERDPSLDGPPVADATQGGLRGRRPRVAAPVLASWKSKCVHLLRRRCIK